MAKKTEGKPQTLLNPDDRLLKPTYKERVEAVPTSEYGRGDIVAPYEKLVQGSSASGLGDSASPLLQQQQYMISERERVEGVPKEKYGYGDIIAPSEKLLPGSSASGLGDNASPLLRQQEYITTEKERVEGEEREEYGKGEIITPQETLLPDTLGSEVGGDSESPLIERKPYVAEEGEAPPDLGKKEIPEYSSDGIKVYAVNGQYVRDNVLVDFTMGGHDLAYPEFIPEGEIWIDGDMNEFDKKTTVIHEYVERKKMEEGVDYEDAHSLYANVAELKARQNPEMADSMLSDIVKGRNPDMTMGGSGEINDVINEGELLPTDEKMLGDYKRLPTLASARMENEEIEDGEKRGNRKTRGGKMKGRPIEVGAFPSRFYLGRKLRPNETKAGF